MRDQTHVEQLRVDALRQAERLRELQPEPVLLMTCKPLGHVGEIHERSIQMAKTPIQGSELSSSQADEIARVEVAMHYGQSFCRVPLGQHLQPVTIEMNRLLIEVELPASRQIHKTLGRLLCLSG